MVLINLLLYPIFTIGDWLLNSAESLLFFGRIDGPMICARTEIIKQTNAKVIKILWTKPISPQYLWIKPIIILQYILTKFIIVIQYLLH